LLLLAAIVALYFSRANIGQVDARNPFIFILCHSHYKPTTIFDGRPSVKILS